MLQVTINRTSTKRTKLLPALQHHAGKSHILHILTTRRRKRAAPPPGPPRRARQFPPASSRSAPGRGHAAPTREAGRWQTGARAVRGRADVLWSDRRKHIRASDLDRPHGSCAAFAFSYRSLRPSPSHTSTVPRPSARTFASIFDRSPTMTQLIASGRNISSAALVIVAGVSAPYFAGSVAR